MKRGGRDYDDNLLEEGIIEKFKKLRIINEYFLICDWGNFF